MSAVCKMLGQVVELTTDQRGTTMLKVNHFKFYHDFKSQATGLGLWRCLRSQCKAHFYADDRYTIIASPDNDFVHNHLPNRTKMVKQFVIDEINKLTKMNRGVGSESELRDHAFKYLDQAFGSTLNQTEMRSVRSAIIKYVHQYKVDMKRSTANREETAGGTGRQTKAKENYSNQESTSDDSQVSFLDLYDTDDSTEDEVVEGPSHSPPQPVPPPQAQVRSDFYIPSEGDEYHIDLEPTIFQAPPFYVKEEMKQEAISLQGGLTLPQYSVHPPPIGLTLANPLPSQPAVEPKTYLGNDNHPPHDASVMMDGAMDEDEKFFNNLLPMFRALQPKDKLMIKVQIHQLINWKLRNVL